MATLEFFKRCWWSTLITGPLAGFFLLFLLPSVGLIAVNSRSLMLSLMVFGCAGLPWLLSKLHAVSPLFVAITFYAVLAAGWIFRPTVFDGNLKLALATYFAPWLISALIASVVMLSFLVRRKAIN